MNGILIIINRNNLFLTLSICFFIIGSIFTVSSADTYSLDTYTGWNTIAFPYIPNLDNVGSDIANYFNAEDVCVYSVASWICNDRDTVVQCLENQCAPVGKYLSYTSIVTNGTEQSATSPVTIHLNQGWNIFKMPFRRSMGWNDENVNACGVSLSQSNTIQKTIYKITPGLYIPVEIGENLDPWYGYWIYTEQKCDIVLTLPPQMPDPPEPGAAFLSYYPHSTGSTWKYISRGYTDKQITQPYDDMRVPADDIINYPDWYDEATISRNYVLNGLSVAETNFSRRCTDSCEGYGYPYPGCRVYSQSTLYPTSEGYYYYEDASKPLKYYCDATLFFIEFLKPFIPSSYSVNYSWIAGVNMGYNQTGKIIDTNATVTVLAGTFSNCLKIEYFIYNTVPIYHKEHYWFCKNIGMVKEVDYTKYGDLEEVDVFELQSYSIK